MDYLVKVVLFLPFMGLIYLFIDYFKVLLVNSISGLTVTSLLCQFGVFDGLSVFFTIIISAFAARQAIDFVK